MWGDEDSVWTEMVRGKDICASKFHDGNKVLGTVSWEEVDYPTGDHKHEAMLSSHVRMGHVSADPEYMHYRSGDFIGTYENSPTSKSKHFDKTPSPSHMILRSRNNCI